MQQPPFPKPRNRFYRLSALTFIILAGCGGPSVSGPVPGAATPHKGVTLKLSCPDAAFAAAVGPTARAWANRTGAAVEILPAPMTTGDAADLAVIPFADLGTWAERGDLAPAPASLRAGDNAYQWLSVLPAYRNLLTAWGGQVLGLPLAGDGHVLVYRADRFADKATAERFAKELNRNPTPPATWDEFAAVALFFNRLDGKPCLPALPDDGAKLTAAFLRVAASYDRQALNESALARMSADANFAASVLSFEFNLETGEPRVAGPGFEAAAGLLAGLKACRGTVADPVEALKAGAVMAVLSLEEVARLPKDGATVQGKFGVAAIPGTRSAIDPATGQPRPPGDATTNYVPFVSGGRLGVVRKSSANAGAAFELLAELSGPDGSQQILSATTLGAGPFRSTHLDRDRVLPWLGYGFDADRSKAFQEALRSFVGVQVGNPAVCQRGPDHAAVTAALAGELQKIASGGTPPGEGLKRVASAWSADPAPAADRLKWRRRAAGFN